MEVPDTLSQAIALLGERGYRDEFELCADGVRTADGTSTHAVTDVEVDVTYRFEGPSDPGDESIVLGVRCSDGQKGIVISAYGPDADPEHARLFVELSKRGR